MLILDIQIMECSQQLIAPFVRSQLPDNIHVIRSREVPFAVPYHFFQVMGCVGERKIDTLGSPSVESHDFHREEIK
ncbi:hypothetical protein A7X57_05900 [Stenotrophomonas maltophilia]|nr:hypothetical protein A7X57_05900 [Stenotrophomonas maltophilia]